MQQTHVYPSIDMFYSMAPERNMLVNELLDIYHSTPLKFRSTLLGNQINRMAQ